MGNTVENVHLIRRVAAAAVAFFSLSRQRMHQRKSTYKSLFWFIDLLGIGCRYDEETRFVAFHGENSLFHGATFFQREEFYPFYMNRKINENFFVHLMAFRNKNCFWKWWKILCGSSDRNDLLKKVMKRAPELSERKENLRKPGIILMILLWNPDAKHQRKPKGLNSEEIGNKV